MTDTSEAAGPNGNIEVRTGLVVEDYDSLGGPATSLSRRQALSASMGAGIGATGLGMASSAHAATSGVNKRIENASLKGPYLDLARGQHDCDGAHRF